MRESVNPCVIARVFRGTADDSRATPQPFVFGTIAR
jgi:hypothetical protein